MNKRKTLPEWRFRELPPELQVVIWRHAYELHERRGEIRPLEGGGWYAIEGGTPAEREPGRPPCYDTEGEALVFLPDGQTVVDLVVASALATVDRRASGRAAAECQKLAPRRGLESFFDKSAPIVNSAGTIVAYRTAEPEADPRLDGLTRQEWSNRRKRELLRRPHRAVALGGRRSDGPNWLPSVTVTVAEVAIGRDDIERCARRLVACGAKGWRDQRLPAGHYPPGGLERAQIEARLAEPGLSWGPWYADDPGYLASMTGRNLEEIVAALHQPDPGHDRVEDTVLEDGSLRSHMPDSFWEEMKEVRDAIIQEQHASHPIPADFDRLWRAWCAKEGR